MIENSEIILVDSNILIYAYTEADLEKKQKALKIINQCWKKEVQLAVSLQNLAEFFFVVTNKLPYPIPTENANQIIKDILRFSHWKKIQYDSESLIDAISFKEQTHFWDTLIAATMLKNNIYKIYTENTEDFSKFPNITAINPF
jgi:predicted nucleic acid-binding protein